MNFLDSLKAKKVYLKKGECILFDPRVFHGSYKNKNQKHRVSLLFSIISENASIITPFFNEENIDEIILRIQPDDFFDLCTDFSKCVIEGFEYRLIY